MSKYVYPAVFTKENGGYSIAFPDIESCFTQGEDLQDGIENAQDALCLMLYRAEAEGKPIPAASEPQEVKVRGSEFVTLIACDTIEYERFFKNKSVKKTLTIPEWLNDMAVRENVNFSNVLQNALMEQLNITK
ncbi:MAG: type II toxin-antitoxin system HicB family antitoxin [Oscillospiraceae bacterium]|nr:type II toxin-antitoxin system HicB family antitoxin [Oscillospiraceae bacterium]